MGTLRYTFTICYRSCSGPSARSYHYLFIQLVWYVRSMNSLYFHHMARWRGNPFQRKRVRAGKMNCLRVRVCYELYSHAVWAYDNTTLYLHIWWILNSCYGGTYQIRPGAAHTYSQDGQTHGVCGRSANDSPCLHENVMARNVRRWHASYVIRHRLSTVFPANVDPAEKLVPRRPRSGSAWVSST